MRLRSPLVFVLALGLLAARPFPQTVLPEDVMPLIVLMGQSNISGRGTPMPVWSNPHAFLFDGEWTLANNPLARDYDAAHGPGPVFIDAYVERYGPVGVIPCSVGGSAISAWQKGQQFYEECATSIRASGGEVRVVLFFQGEAETAVQAGPHEKHPERWAELFQQLVSDFRDDFGPVPFVFAHIGAFPAHEANHYNADAWALVQSQQNQVAIGCVSSIITGDLSGGEVHFYNAAYNIIGWRFFQALRCISNDGYQLYGGLPPRR